MQKEKDGVISAKKPWKRVLYEKQNYKDNYYHPDKIFEQLVVNVASNQKYNLSDFALGCFQGVVIVQQYNAVSLFITVYKYLRVNENNSRNLLGLNIVLWLSLFTAQYIWQPTSVSGKRSLVSGLLFLIYLRIFAPILRTLTSAFSEDTIHALAMTFCFIHLVFHNYGPRKQQDSSMEIMSLSAAMFAAIILASRLVNIQLVVLFLLLAMQLFGTFPEIARTIRATSPSITLLIVGLFWAVTSVSLFRSDWTLFVVYQVGVFILSTLGPSLFLFMQQYKIAYHGPWDIMNVQ